MDQAELREELDEVVARINETVDERRRSGDYPPGLEHELDRHFRQLVHQRRGTDVDTAGALQAVGRVVGVPKFDPALIATSSGTPVGSALHKSVGKLVNRQTLGALQQVQSWRDDVEVALHQLALVADQLADHEHPQLAENVSAVLDRVAVLDQLEVMLFELERRVEALEARHSERSAGA